MDVIAPAAAGDTRLRIDVWVDVACPWCYLGKKRLETAITQSDAADRVDVVLHAFELDPGASRTVEPNLEYLARHLRMPPARARALEEQMRQLAAQEGLPYEIDRAHGNSLDVLRLTLLARTYGLANAFMGVVQERLFSGAADVYEPEFLVSAAERVGVPADEARDVLDGDRFADEVRAEHRAALELGATGVPFTVLDGRYGIPGAVPVDGYREAIATALGTLGS
ncbi:DsbA family oxidoreductase [Microbispora corallina]|uniref:DSBA oxidoreductase n=1 Tax=Microbispora corallina TaxID=83302 RepID=A0ABQ4GB44_9ACTN|nr:DsbA family oxidoreductase [Microbispora corallina]GIH44315.1 DSBA oxidoreductase [Microbispora corallina]